MNILDPSAHIPGPPRRTGQPAALPGVQRHPFDFLRRLLQTPDKLPTFLRQLGSARNAFSKKYTTRSALVSLLWPDQYPGTRPDPGVFHVYVGYAGWTQDQLRAEAQSGAWFVFPADAATVFNSNPDSLWLQMIQKTELQLAKTEPFAETSPVKSR